MTVSHEPGASEEFEVVRVKDGTAERRRQPVATEVPFTIVANETELATLLCTPADMEEFTCGFLYTSGFIRNAGEIHSYVLDPTRWVAHVELERPPDPAIMGRRLFTSGCGKGVMYANVVELSSRRPPLADISMDHAQVRDAAHWLQTSSELYRSTGGVHTAALSDGGC
ncbi:MAG: formate dehydrogenase accessory sulfurtransferase FdhD [Lentisphaerae bacterium]|nr:formate dehydrogenase accessory sulfurtransferase FdhD [Lentisphaerota bacterium]